MTEEDRHHLQELAKQAFMVLTLTADARERLDAIDKDARTVLGRIEPLLGESIPKER